MNQPTSPAPARRPALRVPPTVVPATPPSFPPAQGPAWDLIVFGPKTPRTGPRHVAPKPVRWTR